MGETRENIKKNEEQEIAIRHIGRNAAKVSRKNTHKGINMRKSVRVCGLVCSSVGQEVKGL